MKKCLWHTAVLPIFTHLILVIFKASLLLRRCEQGKHADKLVILLLFQAINTFLAVFQANEHIRALHDASGCL